MRRWGNGCFSWYAAAVVLACALASCEGEKPSRDADRATAPARPVVPTPSFNEDSAYAFVADQVGFGPRIPGTPAHRACADYLAGKLRGYGFKVTVQNAVVETYDKRKFELSNIIASHRPELAPRVLLCAHWDTRPFSDRDPENATRPFDGANDGGSGTAVLLEVGRQLAASQPSLGVDIILFDLEDYGQQHGDELTWALGSQYWSANFHVPGYYARYGILLDMVGAPGAVFPREGYSVQFAGAVVDKVWEIARRSGYGKYFIGSTIQGIVDDHYFINKIANIPCIDIIDYKVEQQDFMACHHRQCDNLGNIDRRSLKIAGQVVLETLFHDLNALP